MYLISKYKSDKIFFSKIDKSEVVYHNIWTEENNKLFIPSSDILLLYLPQNSPVPPYPAPLVLVTPPNYNTA